MTPDTGTQSAEDVTGARQPRVLLGAWLSLAMIPVAFAVAMVIGEGLISAAGYPSGGDELAPLGIALLISVPLTLVAMTPAALAVVLGRRALRQGHRSGRSATIIGWIALAYWSVSFFLALVDRATS
jgi:hypothetical protein